MHYVASLMAKTLIRMFTVWTGDCPTIGCALHLKSAGGASITRRGVPALTRNTSHRRTKPATIYCDGCASFRHRKPCYVILRSPDESLLLRVMAQRIVRPPIFIVTDVWVIARRMDDTGLCWRLRREQGKVDSREVELIGLRPNGSGER